MGLIFVGKETRPTYIALSSDIVANKISGASHVGGTVYLTDIDVWKIIEADLTLGEYALSFGTDAEYSKVTQNSVIYNVVKGALNNFRIRPKVLNEHAESSREAMQEITSTVVAGQVFKASQDNINAISITAQSAVTFASMDAITAGGGENKAGTIEYTNDAALQAEYIKSGAVEAVLSAFTDDASVTQDGNYACKIPTSTITDSWTVTLTSTDLTGVTLSLKSAQTQSFSNAKVYFFIGDGTNTKSYPLTAVTENIWKTFQFEETDMAVETEDLTGTTPDITAITKMGFRIDDSHPTSFAYADSITYQAEGGSFAVELWDLGATLPAGDGTEDYTSIGTQYTELGDRGINGALVSSVNVPLHGGKRVYHLEKFIAGVALEIPANTLLTVGNYYSLVIKYVDTNVTLYGPNTTFSINYYTSGYAWKAEVADNLIDKVAGAAGGGAYSDLSFEIYSTQDVQIIGTSIFKDSASGENAWATINVEDSNMQITEIPSVVQSGGFNRTSLTLDTSLRPLFLEKGGKYEVNYNDDATDDLTKVMFSMSYWFIPPTTNC